MILEVAVLDIKPGMQNAFESAFQEAQAIITKTNGHLSHQLQKCMETENRYILLINWEKLEEHTEGFRKSADYQQWKALLHHFYEPFPTVEHYHLIEN